MYETTGFLPAVAAAEGLVGRPLPQLCATLAGLDLTSPQVQEIVDAYRHLYRTRVVPEAAALAFPGVVSGLKQLHERGLALAVVTSKQSDSARLILEASGLSRYFTTVIGVNDTALPKPHPDPALLALERLEVAPRAAVFVGDTVHDLATAQAVPMRTVAVTYGVGNETELRAMAPTGTVSSFAAVTDLILSLISTESEQH